ncbi:hypothetical protein UFOVP615_13 [uncultured Caudovirales phage]|uniref:Uncharacterized protein n=1 Tax=uncultured Caudovirales phage TaxID=2100421 RepID=A0A6J5N390_9CAUD|nr:hypothetical protein UFOVP615_13 [uncultured Caudovirales phage]
MKWKYIFNLEFLLIIGYFTINDTFSYYPEMMFFLSVLTISTMTSFYMLFNSKILHVLIKEKCSKYGTKLHAISKHLQESLYFNVISIFLILVIPKDILFDFTIFEINVKIQKQIIVLPILATSIFFSQRIFSFLFKIFVIPRN